MLNDTNFVQQTLNSNLYYLRTIRAFALNLQLSFLSNNPEYIDTAKDFGLRCEELGRTLMKYANGNVSQDAIDNKIFVTEYTLDCELLTEKLFDIEIDEEITKQEMNLKPGIPTNISDQMLEELTELNNRALVLVKNFINFCQNIINEMEANELFSYSYPNLVRAMLEETNLYQMNLNRLIARDSADPTFVIDYTYLFNNLFRQYSSFIRGLTNPQNGEIIVRAVSFMNEFQLLAEEYRKTIITPNSQDELNERSVATIERFQEYLRDTIEKLLDARAYLIVEPTFLDNIYTSANYFKYVLTTENAETQV